jgi:peptide/nickel transport system substrate-binding protein
VSAFLPPQPGEQIQITDNEVGQHGGQLVIGERSEPKTLNPVTAADGPSRDVIRMMTADLIDINRSSQKTEPALARSWRMSRDGGTFTLKLRRGIRFSDGYPFNADDVVFSFRVYLDENLHSFQRDLLIVGGKPIEVQKIDAYTVRFTLAQPYAAAERLFDSVAILPRHLLETAYREGKLAQAWGLSTPPQQIAGLGPYCLKEYVPGQRVVLERNRYYWKADRNKDRLPYIDQLTFLFVGSEDAQVIRFQAGDTDVLSRIGAENFALLSKDAASRGYELADLGPSLEYNFLLFNQNDLSEKKLGNIAREQTWFSDLRFRQAVSDVIDRQGIIKLVYAGKATPLWGNVSPSDKLWIDEALPHPARSPEKARALLKSAGFSWRDDGQLLGPKRQPVEFSILTSSSNAQRSAMANIIQQDLSSLGMNVHVVPLEFRALLNRIFQTYDYEAVVLGLGGGDADPNSEINVWLSSGGAHLWHLGESKPATVWEAELDRLMEEQMVQLNYNKRKALYNRVQTIIAQSLPVIFIATPNVLVGARKDLGNFRPAVLEPSTLWNVEQLYFRAKDGARAGAKP